MNAIKTVFSAMPILLCQWHINKDVLAYARKLGEQWSQVVNEESDTIEDSERTKSFLEEFFRTVNSQTEAEFDNNAKSIKDKFPKISQYLERNWWPYKQCFVKSWTNQISHFGEQTTSRIEGSHRTLKTWLETSRLDILTLFERLLNQWTIQEDAYRKKMSESLRTPFTLSGPFFQSVVRIIHTYPLLDVKKRFNEVEEEIKKGVLTPNCSNTFQWIYGMPCKHQIRQMLENKEPILPTHFHAHWWIERAQAPPSSHFIPRVREPMHRHSRIMQRRITHQRGHGVNSTRRDHLHSEIVDANFQTSVSMTSGHQSTTTLNPTNQSQQMVPSSTNRGQSFISTSSRSSAAKKAWVTRRRNQELARRTESMSTNLEAGVSNNTTTASIRTQLNVSSTNMSEPDVSVRSDDPVLDNTLRMSHENATSDVSNQSSTYVVDTHPNPVMSPIPEYIDPLANESEDSYESGECRSTGQYDIN